MVKERNTSEAWAHVALLALVVVWAGSFSAIKTLLDHAVAALDVAILRYAIAAPGFAFILWRAGGCRASPAGMRPGSPPRASSS
jgi:drug/metabolite transporter (DMT)-like permease